MGIEEKTRRVNRELLQKHLESVVSLRVWRVQDAEMHQGGQEQQGSGKGKEDSGTTDDHGTMAVSYGTGFIISCSDNLALVLSCAHTFAAFRAREPKQGETEVSDDIVLKVDFFDGYSTDGYVCAINWSYDMSLVMVFSDRGERRLYRPVKFTESCPLMGFSASERDTPLHSIYCFPTDQDKSLFGTAVSGNICGPSRLGREIDPSLHSELKMVQSVMNGAKGCSGAPLFTQDQLVMGFWISNVGDIKFGVLVESISEWLQNTYKIKETSMNTLVAMLASLYSGNLSRMDPSSRAQEADHISA